MTKVVLKKSQNTCHETLHNLLSIYLTLFKKHVLSDITVYSVNQNVLDIVETASVVITLLVCVTRDVMMVGLDGAVPQVRIFFINEHCKYKVLNFNHYRCITLCRTIMPVSRWHFCIHVSIKKFKFAI